MGRTDSGSKINDIADFTELGPYLEMPVCVYSIGMAARLAFGIVTALDAGILLMDKLIGTGDQAFLAKAQVRLERFVYQSKILVLTSHNESMLRKFCNKALLLHQGALVKFGSVDSVYDHYHQLSGVA